MTDYPAEIKLSVEVPTDNADENNDELEMGQENEDNKVSLDLQPEDNEETERARYGLNSPKREKKSVDEETDGQNDGELTPATKLRQAAGINSPKQQKAMSWGNTDENANANANANVNPLASIITQVSQTDSQLPNGTGGGVQTLITQVSKEEAQAMAAPMDTTKDSEEHATGDQNNQKQQDTGICACLSSLFSCCSTPQATSVELQTAKQIDIHTTDKPEGPKTQTSQPPIEEQEHSPIEEEPEPSQDSSTDYSFALLPPLSPENKGKRCLVLDLDETLVHSSFKPISSADFVIPVEIDGVVHRVYVLKRPFVDEFLLECSKSYELVIFTASLSKYADPLLDQLDTHRVITHRLFRESCTLHGSAYVKDMRRLGRRLKDIIFVDNSPHSYAFQPKNAVPIASWFDDKSDTQLKDFIPVLNTTLLKVRDVRNVLDAHNKPFNWLCRQANMDISKFEPEQ